MEENVQIPGAEAAASDIKLAPYSFAKKHRVMVTKDGVIRYQRGAPTTAIAELYRHHSTPIDIVEHAEDEFSDLLQRTYENRSAQTELISEDLNTLNLDHLVESITESEDLLNESNSAPVVRLMNALLHQGIQRNASDIHFEVYESRMLVRFRIDGVLHDIIEPRRALAPVIISRLKVMAKLDIAEKRLPQDGRISLTLGQSKVDVRVSTIPSNHGERMVLRLLYKTADQLENKALGMSPNCLQAFNAALQKPHGIILITGPTGSGKSTSLYAGLASIRDGKKNLLTIEDPVEFDLDGIGQTQVNTTAGMTFSKGLRAILRQDPDVVMIGEIRDAETARIAIQASLTGHLVLSTLHTNTAVGAVSRLADMGIEPFLLSSSLSALVAQRLVRVLCPECKEPWDSDTAASTILGTSTGQPIFRATGCESCNYTGYSGRTGIYEIVPVDQSLRDLIHDGASESTIAQQAQQQNASLFNDGIRRVLEGDTSVEELLRVTRDAS